MAERSMGKLRIIGGKKSVDEAYELLCENFNTYMQLNYNNNIKEYEIRKYLQEQIDHFRLYNVSVLYDGNTIWSFDKTIRDFKRILNNGLDSLTDHLYKFFHLCCGTIAHYDINGWIANYPSLSSLKPVVNNTQPGWAYDRIKIITEMKKLLSRKGVNV